MLPNLWASFIDEHERDWEKKKVEHPSRSSLPILTGRRMFYKCKSRRAILCDMPGRYNSDVRRGKVWVGDRMPVGFLLERSPCGRQDVVSCQPSLTPARPLHAFVLSPSLALIASESCYSYRVSRERPTQSSLLVRCRQSSRTVPLHINLNGSCNFVTFLKGSQCCSEKMDPNITSALLYTYNMDVDLY